jgi:hypothetical protein
MGTPYGMYGHSQMPVMTGQFPYQPEQLQPHMTMSQDFYPITADISPASLSVQNVEGASALDMGSQVSLQQSYDMQQQALRPIPEANRTTAYPPNAVMNSLMAAANGSYMHNPGMSLDTQETGYAYDSSDYSHGVNFSMSTGLSTELASSQPSNYGYPSINGLPYSLDGLHTKINTSLPNDAQQSNGSISSESSPYSNAQANSTPQMSNGPTPPSVASVVSAYSGWSEDPSTEALHAQPDESEDQFTTPYHMNGASSSEHTLPFWAQPGSNQDFTQGFYQQPNVSSQAVLSSPQQDTGRTFSVMTSEFDPPPMFSDDAYTRRNSSTSNLAGNFEAIHIRTSTPDEFKQPGQPTSLAQRRKGRPVTLNPGAMRSASYSAPMPSPGGNNDHALRRIRSSGIHNAAGRVQKSQPGSAQRSPMVANFADAAASPKFARTFSSSSSATMGQGGSLAPPTPLTPQDMNLQWQSNTVIRPHSVMPEHNSPESMNANWSLEHQNAGMFSKSASPPTTSLDLQQMTQPRYVNEAMYRDSPPQSAPATQQNFPRPMYMQHPHTRPGFHSTTDLTIAQPKPSHFRRPSLQESPPQPDGSNYFPGSNFNYNDYKDISLTNINHNVPFAPSASMAPEFLVHEFMPPQGSDAHGNIGRRQTDSQPKSYIFANQGPGDFRHA